MGGTNVRTMTPGLIEFEQFLVESGWRVDSERKAISRDVRDTLVSEAKKKTALKMKVNHAPMSKTMLSKVKVGDLRDAAKVLGLDQVMQGVTKKADVVAYLLAYYEYMHGTIDARPWACACRTYPASARRSCEKPKRVRMLRRRAHARQKCRNRSSSAKQIQVVWTT